MVAHHRHGDARPDGRLRPLPRPQVRPDPATRLLPPALDVHDDRAQRGRPRPRPGRATSKAKAAFDAEHAALADGAGEVREGAVAAAGSRRGEKRGAQAEPAVAVVAWSTPVVARSRPAARRSRKQADGSLLASGKNADVRHLHLRRRTRSLTSITRRAARGAGATRRWSRAGRAGRPTATSPSPTCRSPSAAQRGDGKAGRGEADQPAGDVRAEGPAGRRGHRRRPDDSAWAVDPQFGKDHAAVVRVREARRLRRAARADLHAALQQQHRPQHRPAAALAERQRRRRRPRRRTALPAERRQRPSPRPTRRSARRRRGRRCCALVSRPATPGGGS